MKLRTLFVALFVTLSMVTTSPAVRQGVQQGVAECAWPDCTPIPGITNAIGNRATLEHFLDMDYWYARQGTPIYVSNSAGGDITTVGDDDNDGLTITSPIRSIDKVDSLIEDGCNYYDFRWDAGDTWIALALDLNHKDATVWDGSLGPPPAGCGTNDIPAFYSGPYLNPVNGFVDWDLRNMTEDQLSEECTGCDDNNDGLFYGGHDFGNDQWIAVEHHRIINYPNAQENSGTVVKIKDLIAGNVYHNRMDFGIITGNQVNLTSQHGGIDIGFNPVIYQRPNADFYSACTGAQTTQFSMGCADDDDMTNTVLCTSGGGDDIPFDGCLGSDGTWENQAPLFLPVNGSNVLISRQTYWYAIAKSNASVNFQAIFSSANGADLFLLGPMKLRRTVEALDHKFISIEADTAGVRESFFYFYALDVESFGESPLGPAFTLKNGTNNQWHLNFHKTLLTSIGYLSTDGPDINQTTQDSIRFNCNTVRPHALADYFLNFVSDGAVPDSAANGTLFMEAKDNHLDERDMLTNLGYIEGVDTKTFADMRTAMGLENAITFTDWFNEFDHDEIPLYDKVVPCNVTMEVRLPSVSSGGASASTNIDAYLPWWVGGIRVNGFDL